MTESCCHEKKEGCECKDAFLFWGPGTGHSQPGLTVRACSTLWHVDMCGSLGCCLHLNSGMFWFTHFSLWQLHLSRVLESDLMGIFFLLPDHRHAPHITHLSIKGNVPLGLCAACYPKDYSIGASAKHLESRCSQVERHWARILCLASFLYFLLGQAPLATLH